MSIFVCKGTLARLLTGLMVAALFSVAFVVTGPSARAATGSSTGTATITGGSLSLTAPEDFSFGEVTLDGMSDQTTTGTFSVGVDDPTGTNAGWELKASLTLLSNGTNTLPDAAQILQLSDITPNEVGGSTPAENSANSFPFTFPTSASSAAVFYNAAAGSGQGQHTYSVKVTQNVAKNSFAGNYSGTLTVSLDAGPA